MKSLFKKYLWLWEFIGVAIILGVGIVARFVPAVLYFIVGIAFIIMAVFRIIPLIKTTLDKVLKVIYLLEIVINVIIGIVLIVFATKGQNMQETFGYLIGSVLYLRALVHFYSTSIRKESSDYPQFIAHVIFITVGTAIIARGGFTEAQLGWVILAIAILSGIFISFDGYKNYRKYRNEKVAQDITKNLKKEKEVEAPTSEEIIPPREEENKEINA